LQASHADVILEKTGHSYIKARVAASNAIAGFEKSGHWFFNEPLGRRYDDAVVSALHVLRLLDETGQPLSRLIDALPVTWSSPTMEPDCADDLKYKVVDAVTEMYRNDQRTGVEVAGQQIRDIVTVNGVRFVLEDGSWGLVRASSNRPSLVVVAESASSEDRLYGIVEQIQQRLAATGQVGAYDQQLPARASKK
jgi:phosphomannomutase/phosphoglucomutase